MTIAEFCVFGVVALYLLTIVPVKWLSYQKYDNRPGPSGSQQAAMSDWS